MSDKLWNKIPHQKDAYTSSWSKKEVLLIYLWRITWKLFYSPTPKHLFNGWRLFLLRLFGASITGRPFLFPTSKIFAPWLLTIGNKSCLGPYSEIYNLGPVEIGDRVTISQYSYICNGSHDFSKKNLPLIIGNISIDDDVFIGAHAIILPGLNIGRFAVIGAGSVVSKNIEAYYIVGGNPAKFIKKRVINNA